MNTDNKTHMKKSPVEDIRIIGKNTIFSIDYLQNAELTDEDLNNLFKRGNFLKSIIVAMYEFENLNISVFDILEQISTDNSWIHSHEWTRFNRQRFEKSLTKAIKNIYSYRDSTARSKAEWITTIYGFDVKESANKKKYYRPKHKNKSR